MAPPGAMFVRWSGRAKSARGSFSIPCKREKWRSDCRAAHSAITRAFRMHLHRYQVVSLCRWPLSLFVLVTLVHAVEKPRGIFASAGAGNTPSDANGIYGDAHLRGVLIRVSWDALEPTAGSYNFSSLTAQINNVKSKGLGWSLGVLGGGIGSPAWLTNPTSAGGLGAPYVTYSFRGTPGYKLPLFWNSIVQTRLQLLAQALAAQFNNDTSLKLVYIPQMTANGIEGHLQGVGMSDLVAAGYTDANWIAAGKQAATSFANAFTNKALAFEVHEVNGTATVPSTIINDLWNDAALGQRVGAAVWWLSGRTTYQPNLLTVLDAYPGDIYAQVIANSGTPSEFPNGDYTALFTQAKQLLIRYIEPWDYEFTNQATNSAKRKYDPQFADFNTWADATFTSDGGSGNPPAATAPTITTQPASQTVTAGASASFTVAAGGTAPLSYQWKLGGANVASATSATLTIATAQSANAGSYMVVVSNSAGSVTSNAATLTVNAAPATPATPPASSTSGGGGAPSGWFLLAFAALLIRRTLASAGIKRWFVGQRACSRALGARERAGPTGAIFRLRISEGNRSQLHESASS
ncbi:MAG: immunoglobulin domain-containing protein [Nocardioides sp.]